MEGGLADAALTLSLGEDASAGLRKLGELDAAAAGALVVAAFAAVCTSKSPALPATAAAGDAKAAAFALTTLLLEAANLQAPKEALRWAPVCVCRALS
jgi:hypothetical protein